MLCSWGGGSVDHGRWGGEDERHASVGTGHCGLERLDEENAAMVGVVAGSNREALGNVEVGKEAAEVFSSDARGPMPSRVVKTTGREARPRCTL